ASRPATRSASGWAAHSTGSPASRPGGPRFISGHGWGRGATGVARGQAPFAARGWAGVLHHEPIHERRLATPIPLIRARLRIAAVRTHGPRVAIRGELQVQHRPQALASSRIVDRHQHLDATLEIALHAIGGADEILLGAAVAEVV